MKNLPECSTVLDNVSIAHRSCCLLSCRMLAVFILPMLATSPVALLGWMPAFWLDQRLATLMTPDLLVECTMSVSHMKNVLTQKLTFLHVMANMCRNNFEVGCTVGQYIDLC